MATDDSQAEPWPFVESDRHGWPAHVDLGKLREAQLEVRKKRTDQEIARARAEEDAEIASAREREDAVLAVEQEYFKSILEVAKGSVDRARASAETVQKAAGAIGTIYAAALAVSFSVAERPFPAKGIIPAVLLGFAIAFSTTFLAYLPDPEDERSVAPDDSDTSSQLVALMNTFIRWTRHSALNPRVNWLRASVVSLGAAVALLPAPFVVLGGQSQAAVSTGGTSAATPGMDVADTSTPEWPRPGSAAPGANIELRKILYQAQVNEAANQRESRPLTKGELDWIWWVGFGFALLIIGYHLLRRPGSGGSGPGLVTLASWIRFFR